MYDANNKKIVEEIESGFLVEYPDYKYKDKVTYFEIDNK